jgi:hypothetical protein
MYIYFGRPGRHPPILPFRQNCLNNAEVTRERTRDDEAESSRTCSSSVPSADVDLLLLLLLCLCERGCLGRIEGHGLRSGGLCCLQVCCRGSGGVIVHGRHFGGIYI